MTTETIAEHTVAIDMLPENALILDLGCLGFLFTDEMTRRGHELYPVDIQDFDDGSEVARSDYSRVAISNYNGFAKILTSPDKQAARITPIGSNSLDMVTIRVVTLGQFSQMVKVNFWDLIKIDVEGAEYEIIMSITKPPATQLSIEFHLHTGIYTDKNVTEMENKLKSLGYYPAQHEKYAAHGCGMNYWDSLWILGFSSTLDNYGTSTT